MNHDAQLVPIDSLKPYKGNPRRGDVEAIRESLRVNGQYRPLVVRSKTREVLAGNHTLQAADAEGWTEVWATFVDCDAKTARRIVLVDNRSNDLAGYDDAALLSLLHDLNGSYEGSGYDESAVDLLIAEANAEANAGRDTAPGAVPADPRTKPGDLWLLGEHRLLCGDSTSATDVEKLMAGAVAEAMWTDPPYGVEYKGKTAQALTIQNDGAEGLPGLLRDAFTLATTALTPGAPVYVAHPAGAQSLDFAHAFVGAGWRLHQSLIWRKNTIVLGHSDYHFSHEPLLYGYTAGGGRSGRGKHAGSRWYGDNSQSSVLSYDKPAASREHPTAKPIGLIEQCLGNSSKAGERILDPFAGSGTTLIACENLGRRCYAMELDPGYCDVIVDRWQRHTGKTAELAPQP